MSAPAINSGGASRAQAIGGWALSGLLVLFLLMDAVMKIMMAPQSVDFSGELGVQAAAVRPLGLLLLAITALYVFPRTAVLGAVLLTGYLGGAVATHLIHGSPIFSHVLFGVYIGVAAWAGLWLREPRVRSLIV